MKQTSIYDYLVWIPSGKYKIIADKLDTLKSNPTELYRGIGKEELIDLLKNKVVQSIGKGHTRKEKVLGSYVSEDIKLASRFALTSYRDTNYGYVLILNRSKLPGIIPRDLGNYTTEYIPLHSVKKIVNLERLSIE